MTDQPPPDQSQSANATNLAAEWEKHREDLRKVSQQRDSAGDETPAEDSSQGIVWFIAAIVLVALIVAAIFILRS